MTENASFKRRVRERMSRTGERYTTARLHLLARHGSEPPEGLLPGWSRTGGLQPDLAATANALAHVGATGPTGAPLDEVDALGLSGGIGFMYAVFVYAGHRPTLTLTTRTESMPDATVGQTLARAGVAHRVEDTRSAAKAARTLDDALDGEHPVLLSLDESHLPDHEGDPDAVAGMPRVVGCVGRTPDGRFLLDDQAPLPVAVDADTLTAARAGLPRSSHHAVVLEGVVAPHDVCVAALDALRRTVVGYDEPPARPFAKNVGTRGLRTWAASLTGGDARSWPSLFADGEDRRWALGRTAAWIDEDLAAPGASRGLWATWLDRVATATGLDGLTQIADAARESETRWLALATAARGAGADRATTDAVFADLAAQVEDIADTERTLLDELAAVLDDA